MFNWLKNRRYRDQVMVNVLALTVMTEGRTVDLIYEMLPGLKEHLDNKFKEGADPYIEAVDIASIVLT